MEAIEFDGVNAHIGEGQAQYKPLPAFFGPIPVGDNGNNLDGITCCFKLSPEELAEINRTGVVWHTVLTFGMPLQPQHMTVLRPKWIPE
jgi:hypothetical protein